MSIHFNEIQKLVDELVADLPLADLVSFANMGESGVEVIQQAFAHYIRQKYEKEDGLPEIMKALWHRVRETHRLRAVK